LKRTLTRSLSIFVGSVIGLTVATSAEAQESSRTEKLMLSFGLGGASIDSDELESERETGGGFSAQLGWGFTRRFTLLADASGAVLGGDDEEFVLVHFDLLGRFHLGSTRGKWIPYLEGGLSARVAAVDDLIIDDGSGNPQQVDLEISGGGLTLGGGILYHLSPAWALGASLRITSGEFSTVKFNNVSIEGFEVDATSTRFNIGVTWRPMAGGR
jgi:opacity protein-like surface antigen